MTKLMNYAVLLLMALSLVMIGCGDDNDNTTGKEITYKLVEIGDSNVSGTIEFEELITGDVQAEISLMGTSDGNTHPAHIHMNSALAGGDIIISLDPVDGATGSSVTIISTMDNGTDFSYDMLLDLDAYVNVHLSASQLQTIVSQGDIGGNALTDDSATYDLNERAVDGIDGQVTFAKRKNGNTLATIELDGTPDGGMHPAHIHANSYTEGGAVVVSLNPVDGSTGTSRTDIVATDDGTALDYEDILTINGYVNVHLSASDLATIVAQGDIGLNELTGESVEYDLDEKAVPGISGDIKFEERKDGSVLATIDIDGTPDGGLHPAHIHNNSAEEGGPVAVSFNPVDGNTGMSMTSVRMLDDGSSFSFQELTNFDGYVNVHLSIEDLATIVAQGNIGVNDN